ncbi:hypothetical protein U1Q18_021385 [Sarracenia purpurea var. burkii]
MVSKKSLSSVLFMATTLLLFAAVSSCPCPPRPPTRNPNQTPSPSRHSCPRDTLKLAACADLLNGAVGGAIGTPPGTRCCSLLGGLVDLEAVACLCTALRANILGVNLNIPVSLALVINTCGNKLPSDFICV